LAITPEGWTAKDVLAHLIHYAGQVAWALGAPLQPPPYVLSAQGRPSGGEWNAMAVAHYHDESTAAVRAEFERMVGALLDRARLLTDDQVNASATDAVAWASKRPLWQFIAGDTFLHWQIHAAAIEQAAKNVV
jgi:hypothetical protein